jgi:hypothetical protein
MNQNYKKAFEKIQKHKPHLAHTFLNIQEYLSKRMPASSVECVERLTYVSEYLYIDPSSVLEQAIGRGELALLTDILYTLSVKNIALAKVTLDAYRNLSFSLEKLYSAIFELIQSGLDALPRGEKVLSFCLSWRDEEACLFFLRHFTVVIRFAPGVGHELIQFLRRPKPAVPFLTAKKWVSRAADLLSSNRVEEGVLFLRRQTKESRSLLGLRNAVLTDMKIALKIYTASLAKKEMNIVSVDTSAFSFRFPYTDGKSVFLPSEVELFQDIAANERTYTVMAAQQAASLSAGTFFFDMKAITFGDELQDRYRTQGASILENVRKQYRGTAKSVKETPDGEIEVVFPSGRKFNVLLTQHEKFFFSFPAPDLARALFILVENSRIAHVLSHRYPGLKEDYALINSSVWAQRKGKKRGIGESHLLQTMECLLRYSLVRDQTGAKDDPSIIDTVQGLKDHFDLVLQPNATVQHSAQACFHLFNILYDHFPVINFCAQNDVREVFANPVWPEIVPEVIREVSPELLVEKEAAPTYDDLEQPSDRALDLTSLAEKAKKSNLLGVVLSERSLKVFQYPEYDFFEGGFHEKHCTLYERMLPSRESDTLEKTIDRYQQLYKKMKKRFLMIKPEAVEFSRRWISGDEIHLSDAVDYATDLLRDATPDEKIYTRKVSNIRDIAVAVLLDASSSTDEMIGDQRVIDVEKTSLCLLASVLHIIGDPFGLFAFFSQGRHRVFFNVVKDFGELWDKVSQGRIDSIEAHDSNRDGCAIRHLSARLQARPEKTKLLILLSDGTPADLGYGGKDSAETSEYAIEDTRRSILDCRRQGIVPFCVTIDRFGKDYVPHLYGDYSYVVIDDVFKLPEKLSKLYLRLTR